MKEMRLTEEAVAPTETIVNQLESKTTETEKPDTAVTNVEAASVTEVKHSGNGKATHIQLGLKPKPGEHDSLIRRIMAILGQPLKNLSTVASSPPCETFSAADASNVTRDNFHRDHSKKDKPPRSEESGKTAAAHHKRRRG